MFGGRRRIPTVQEAMLDAPIGVPYLERDGSELGLQSKHHVSKSVKRTKRVRADPSPLLHRKQRHPLHRLAVRTCIHALPILVSGRRPYHSRQCRASDLTSPVADSVGHEAQPFCHELRKFLARERQQVPRVTLRVRAIEHGEASAQQATLEVGLQLARGRVLGMAVTCRLATSTPPVQALGCAPPRKRGCPCVDEYIWVKVDHVLRYRYRRLDRQLRPCSSLPRATPTPTPPRCSHTRTLPRSQREPPRRGKGYSKRFLLR